MKKIFTFIAAFAVSIIAMNAQTVLFYTDFVSTPSNLASYVSSSADVTLANPTNSTTDSPAWTIAGHSSNKLAKSTQTPYSGTTLSATGRLGLGGAAGYFTIFQLQGPFTVDVYYGVSSAGKTLVVTLGTGSPITRTPAAVTTAYKESFTYTGTDKADVKVGCAGGGIYVYDVKISAVITTPSNNNQTVAAGSSIADIAFPIVNETGASVTGLPTGLNGTYSNGTFTVSGTVDASVTTGDYAYTVTTTPSNAVASGTITVSPSTGINDTKADNGAVVKTEYFNVTGGYVGADANALPNGIYIKKLTYENGAVVSSKTILRK